MNTSLLCKPAEKGTVFKKYISELGAAICLRSLDLEIDQAVINDWVNKAYAKKFWQLDGQGNNLKTIYEAVMDNPAAHSFIGEIDGKPFCQLDVYAVAIDELAEHIDEVKPEDAGVHILMCPPREMEKGWSFYALKCFQEYFFSFDHAGNLYAEPDQNNYQANRLAINTGFQFMKTINLSYKTANLYRISPK